MACSGPAFGSKQQTAICTLLVTQHVRGRLGHCNRGFCVLYHKVVAKDALECCHVAEIEFHGMCSYTMVDCIL